jgi:isocitrate/isopropylmalate dehydrogenase
MLRYSFGLEEEARTIEGTCAEVIRAGTRTADLAPAGKAATTNKFGQAVCAAMSFDAGEGAR